jgi:hypothetical protein
VNLLSLDYIKYMVGAMHEAKAAQLKSLPKVWLISLKN